MTDPTGSELDPEVPAGAVDGPEQTSAEADRDVAGDGGLDDPDAAEAEVTDSHDADVAAGFDPNADPS